jgi:hypothetical protein
MDKLVGVRPVPVNNCVAQSFLKSQFYGGLIPGNAARPFDLSHEPVHERRNSSDFARHPGIDLEEPTILLSSLEG